MSSGSILLDFLDMTGRSSAFFCARILYIFVISLASSVNLLTVDYVLQRVTRMYPSAKKPLQEYWSRDLK